jgi:hypothetical protein
MMLSESATVSGFILPGNHRSSTYAITYDAVYNCWYCEGGGADVWPPAKQTDTTRQKTAHSADDAAPSFLLGLSAIGGLDYIPLFIKRP